MSNNEHKEELAIRITIPPKPEGMNPGPCPNEDTQCSNDNNLDFNSAIFPISSASSKHASDATYITKHGSTYPFLESGDIGLKSLLNQEEDFASSKMPFVWKLYEMLEDVERNGQDTIVSWVDGGKAFKVHKMKFFVNDIIPKYFRQTKYKSFQRQLYFYDFHRIQDGPDSGAYHHPKFVKGFKTMCLSILPKKNSNRRNRKTKGRDDASSSQSVQEERPLITYMQEKDDRSSRWLNEIDRGAVASFEGLTQKESPILYGADPVLVPKVGFRHHSSFSDNESTVHPLRMECDGPSSDGDKAFVFGGQPFYFVDVDFLDIYPTPHSTGHLNSSDNASTR